MENQTTKQYIDAYIKAMRERHKEEIEDFLKFVDDMFQARPARKQTERRTKKEFVPPTPEQVTSYCAEEGYKVDGEKFCKFYGANDWKDSKDKPLKNWKQKALAVWCKPENKINTERFTEENMVALLGYNLDEYKNSKAITGTDWRKTIRVEYNAKTYGGK